jgi:hypothetical protein
VEIDRATYDVCFTGVFLEKYEHEMDRESERKDGAGKIFIGYLSGKRHRWWSVAMNFWGTF